MTPRFHSCCSLPLLAAATAIPACRSKTGSTYQSPRWRMRSQWIPPGWLPLLPPDPPELGSVSRTWNPCQSCWYPCGISTRHRAKIRPSHMTRNKHTIITMHSSNHFLKVESRRPRITTGKEINLHTQDSSQPSPNGHLSHRDSLHSDTNTRFFL